MKNIDFSMKIETKDPKRVNKLSQTMRAEFI